MRKKTKILDVVVFGVFSFLRFGSAIEVAWAGNRVRDFSAKIGNLFLPTTKKRKLSRDQSNEESHVRISSSCMKRMKSKGKVKKEEAGKKAMGRKIANSEGKEKVFCVCAHSASSTLQSTFVDKSTPNLQSWKFGTWKGVIEEKRAVWKCVKYLKRTSTFQLFSPPLPRYLVRRPYSF